MSEFISILERIRPGYKVGGLVEKGTELYAKYPPGVRYRPERNKAKPYEVIKDGKSVGKFKTEKQAAEAYKKLKIPKGKIGLSVKEFKTLRLKNKNLTDSEFIRKVIKDKYVTEYGGKFDRVAVGLYNESAGISKQVTKAAVPRKVGEIKEVLNRTKQGKESVKLYNQGKLSLEDLRYKATQSAARKKKADTGFYRSKEYLARKREYERTPKARKTRRLRNKAARQAFENKYGIWTSGNNPKDRFWKSLYTSTQGKGSSRLQLVKETVPKKFKGANVKDVKFYDTKTGKTFGYNDLQNYINKNVGKGAYEKVLTPFKEKFLLNETFFDYKGKNVNLNQLLNKTLIPNYNAGNPYHTSMQVHHPFGIKRNPFVTQLLAYDKNFKEFRPREAVIPDIKKAKTFGEKRKVFETFVKKSDPKVLTAPGKKIYGKDVDTITKVKDLYKSQGKRMPPEVLKALKEASTGGTKFYGGIPLDPALFKELFSNPFAGDLTLDASSTQLGTGRLGKTASALKNIAKVGGKAFGLAAIPFEVANMLDMRKQGKTTAEILASPFFLSGRVAEAQDLMKMTPLERQAVSEQQIAGDESMLDTDFYTPTQEGIEAVDVEAVQERVRKQREEEERQRALERSRRSGFTYPNMYGITSVKGVI